MRTTIRIRGLCVLVLVVSSWASAGEKKKTLLNRSIYMPIEFQLCEHLGDAIFYENDQPTSAMPAERVFQFTYYPELGALLPEQVPIRIEGAYLEDDAPFVAKLAVTADGVYTANRFRSTNTQEQVEKSKHKVDIRLKPRTMKLVCQRVCKKRANTVAKAQ